MPIPTLPVLSVAKSLPRAVDVLVVGLDGNGGVGVPDGVEGAYRQALGVGVAELAASLGLTATAGKQRTLPALAGAPRLVVVGLGTEAATPESLRRAAGTGVREAAALADGGPLSVAVSLHADEPETAQAVAEGALLGAYAFSPVSTQPPPAPPVRTITVLTSRKVEAAVLSTASIVARAVVTAREWVNAPPNLLYPDSFAEEIRGLVKDSRVAVEVLDEKALAKGGYGGILAVGSGSARPPRLVRLSYAPRGATYHIAVVGKGITFDSGGLNLKPGDSMYTMKCDMAGAAAIIAATDAIARLGLKVRVTAYAALAENLPSDMAYRPSDVLTMYGGKTVENGNTDAEGRLVLADALVRAGEDAPDLIVDVATLTGACVVALGDKIAGLMASDDQTADRLLDAAEAAGEDLWHLPIPKDIRSTLDSKVADLRSTSTERGAGALVAAAFLREFVGGEQAWAHLDIAGPAYIDGGPRHYLSAGGTGYGVRTLVALARTAAAAH